MFCWVSPSSPVEPLHILNIVSDSGSKYPWLVRYRSIWKSGQLFRRLMRVGQEVRSSERTRPAKRSKKYHRRYRSSVFKTFKTILGTRYYETWKRFVPHKPYHTTQIVMCLEFLQFVSFSVHLLFFYNSPSIHSNKFPPQQPFDLIFAFGSKISAKHTYIVQSTSLFNREIVEFSIRIKKRMTWSDRKSEGRPLVEHSPVSLNTKRFSDMRIWLAPPKLALRRSERERMHMCFCYHSVSLLILRSPFGS